MSQLIIFNAHPKGVLTNDCVIRAISKATSQDYLEVRKELNRIKRNVGAKNYKTRDIWTKVLSDAERIQTMHKGDSRRITGRDFAEQHPVGSYVLKMAKHIVACVDGDLYDTWDCSDKMVYFALRVK